MSASRGLKNVVVDEIHLLESITGANTSGVIRRLCALAESDLMLTGCSATVAEPKEHLAKVFGRHYDEIAVVQPDPDNEMELTGIIHHVLHRGIEGQNFQSNLTNLTSLVAHVRRRRAEEATTDVKEHHKTLGFSDSLHLLGSWEYQVRDNEGLELTQAMRQNMARTGRAGTLLPKKDPLPFRFNRPLVQLAHTLTDGQLPPVEECEAHCSNCIAGDPSTLNVNDGSVLRMIKLDPFRPELRLIEGADTLEGPVEVGITDGCPFFRTGSCWREEVPFDPIELYPDGPRVYSTSMYPTRLTADTISNRDPDSERALFKIKLGNFHSMPPRGRDQLVDRDRLAAIALGSPAIEVGMDFDNALDAVLFKAIRNVSAYRQKIGRLGRERFRDVYGAMLTSFRAVDYHYYRNPAPLLSNDRLEPIPLSTDNENVRSQTAFMAVFDDIARYGAGQSRTISSLAANELYTNVVRDALVHIADVDSVANRIQQGLNEPDIGICRDAVVKVSDQLGLLVEDISTLLAHGATCLADRIGSKRGVRGPRTHFGSGLHALHLSDIGKRYQDEANRLRELVSEFAVNQHLLPDDEDELVDLFEHAVRIWDDIEKGLDSDEVGEFLDKLNDEDSFRRILLAAFDTRDQKLASVLVGANAYSDRSNEWDPEISRRIRAGGIALGISIRDWNAEARPHTMRIDWWYLKDLFSGLHVTRHRHPHVFQKVLFESPNTAKTKLFIPRGRVPGDEGQEDGQNHRIEDVTIREVLFGHAPGMWSYRRGDSPMKTKCYQALYPTEVDGVMALPLHDPPREEKAIKHKVIRQGLIHAEDVPWNHTQDDPSVPVIMYKPEQLNLMRSRGPDRGNKIRLSPDFPVAADGDDMNLDLTDDDSEENEDGRAPPRNIPECIALQWRSIIGHLPIPVTPYSGPIQDVEFELDALSKLLFRDIEFDTLVTAKEFVLGHVRKYQGGDELTVQYVSDRVSGSAAALGHEFQTHGVAFSVEPGLLAAARDWTNEMMDYETSHPVRYLVLQHILRTQLQINRFSADFVLRLVLHSTEYQVPATLGDWLDAIRGLTGEQLNLFEADWGRTALGHISLATLEAAVLKIANEPELLEPALIRPLVEDWSVRTLSNSIGINLLQAGREFTGSRDDDLGYHVTLGGAGLCSIESDVKIWLYDRSPDGNGTTQTINNWYNIPRVVRELADEQNRERRNLPTRDFIDVLARYLQPCEAHMATVTAYACDDAGVDPSTIHNPLARDIQFDHSNYNEDWARIRDEYGFDGSTHVFVNLVYHLIEPDSVRAERTKKAASGCHTSCVQCIEEFGISMLGPLDGPLYACKRMIEDVLSAVMKANPDDFRVDDLTIDGAARGMQGIGTQDPENPLTAMIDGNEVEVFPMYHPVRMWTEINTDEPFLEDGSLNVRSWTNMNRPRWS